MSPVRKGLMFVNLLFRFVIFGMLLWIGAVYLAYTTSLEDIILNACALEFVRDIDDMIFANLLDAHFQLLLENFQPMQLGRPLVKFGCKVWEVVWIVTTAVIACGFFLYYTRPTM